MSPHSPLDDPLRRGPPLPLLDPKESTPHFPPTPSLKPDYDTVRDEICFRHGGWTADRRRTQNALLHAFGHNARYRNFNLCGWGAWVLQDPDKPERLRVSASYCHDRWCRPCANTRSKIIAANLAPHITDQPHRFITLTLSSDDEPLNQLLGKLYLSFARLRRTTLWKKTVAGGAAFCEVKWNLNKTRWHPHLHIVAEGKFLPKADLSAAWLKITRDSYVVDVSLIRDHTVTLKYITKYASKPLDPSLVRDPDRLIEAMLALSGKRLCLCFGTWYGICLSTVTDDTDWQKLQPLNQVLRLARTGDRRALAILSALRRPDPWLPKSPEDPTLWDQ